MTGHGSYVYVYDIMLVMLYMTLDNIVHDLAVVVLPLSLGTSRNCLFVEIRHDGVGVGDGQIEHRMRGVLESGVKLEIDSNNVG